MPHDRQTSAHPVPDGRVRAIVGGMSMAVPEYTPPNPAIMQATQNSAAALRLLLTQRRLYRKAKRWLAAKWFGMLVIGLAAPVVSIIYPKLAVAGGALAGLWLFLGRTFITSSISSIAAAGAAVQEQFDFAVFKMPVSISRSALPSPEDIAKIAGPDDQLSEAVVEERLLDWYPFDVRDSGNTAVAIAQRSNAAYSDSLLRTTAKVWVSASVVWALFLICVSIAFGVGLGSFFLGVLFPLLPAALDVVEYIGRIRSASRERGDLARAIAASLAAPDSMPAGPELLVWQESMFHLRKAPPEVPEIVYRLSRTTNEGAMTRAAKDLGGGAGTRGIL